MVLVSASHAPAQGPEDEDAHEGEGEGGLVCVAHTGIIGDRPGILNTNPEKISALDLVPQPLKPGQVPVGQGHATGGGDPVGGEGVDDIAHGLCPL